MAYVKAPIPSEVYHLTQMDKLDDILDDGKIRRFGDTECWFCESLAKMKAYMEQTVLCEGNHLSVLLKSELIHIHNSLSDLTDTEP